MASHASRVRRDIDRWVAAGLIERITGEALLRDVEASERRSFSFGAILAIMAALLLGAAILVFVASNWEAIPRLARVGALFAVILAGYVGGAVLKTSDHAALGEAVWLIAAAAFGGSIALIGQTYHLSGEETEAILTWCAGTIVAAAALRSGVLTMGAVGLATAWFFLRGVDFWRHTDFPHGFVGLAAILWLVSYWTRSAGSRHLILLSLILYAAFAAANYDTMAIAAALTAVSAALFALAVLLPEPVEKIARVDGLLPLHALLGFLTGIVMIQMELADETGSGFALAAAIALVGIAAAVLSAGRDSRGLRWIAYTGFAVELCIIYAVMVGTMLDTAGFFLAAGLLLGALAFAIIRIEKSMRGPALAAGAAA